MYFRSGSNLSRPSIVFSYLSRLVSCANGMSKKGESPYMVNTIPPLNMSLASLGSAPDQNTSTPSFLKIFATQSKLFLYRLLASIDLHSRLDCVDRHRGIASRPSQCMMPAMKREGSLHRDQARHTSNSKRTHCSELFSRSHISLRKLLNRRIT